MHKRKRLKKKTSSANSQEQLNCLITSLAQSSTEYGIHMVDDECLDDGLNESWEDLSLSMERCGTPAQPGEMEGSVTIDGFDFRTIELETGNKNVDNKTNQRNSRLKGNSLPPLKEDDGIIPTKTTDVRKIKGWKKKVFSIQNDIDELVKEKKLHYDDTCVLNSNEIKIEEESIPDDCIDEDINTFLQYDLNDFETDVRTNFHATTADAPGSSESSYKSSAFTIPVCEQTSSQTRIQTSSTLHILDIPENYASVHLSNSGDNVQSKPKTVLKASYCSVVGNPEASSKPVLINLKESKNRPIQPKTLQKCILNTSQENQWTKLKRQRSLLKSSSGKPFIKNKQLIHGLISKVVDSTSPLEYDYTYITSGASMIRINGSKRLKSPNYPQKVIEIHKLSDPIKPFTGDSKLEITETVDKQKPPGESEQLQQSVIPKMSPILPPAVKTPIPVFGIKVEPKIGVPLPVVITDQLRRLRGDRVDIDTNWITFATSVVSTDGISHSPNNVVFTVKVASKPGEPLVYEPEVYVAEKVDNKHSFELSMEDANASLELIEVKSLMEEMLNAVVKQVDLSEQPPFDPADRDCNESELPMPTSKVSAVPFKRMKKLDREMKLLNVVMIEDKPAAQEVSGGDSDKICPLETCRLGCVCSSLHLENCRGYDHCSKAECMLNCCCSLQIRDKAYHISLSEGVVSKINLSMKHLAKKEKEFQQTVVVANNGMIVVEGCQVPITGRRRRDIKLPQRYRDEEEEPRKSRGSPHFENKLVDCNPLKLPTNAYIPNHVAHRKADNLNNVIISDLMKDFKLGWCTVQMFKLVGLDDVELYCMHHFKYNCSCIFTVQQIDLSDSPSNVSLLPRPKPMSRNVAVKRTASVRNLHDSPEHSARTNGIHFDYAQRNKTRWLIRKQAQDSNSGCTPTLQKHSDVLSTSENVALGSLTTNTTEADVIYLESLQSTEQDVSVTLTNLPVIDIGKFTNALLTASDDKDESKMMRWSILQEGFKTQSIHMWVTPDTPPTLYMSSNNIKPDVECVDLRSRPKIAEAIFSEQKPTATRDFDKYAILCIDGKHWRVGAIKDFPKNQNMKRTRRDIKFLPRNAVMKVPLPQVRSWPYRWYAITLNNGFDKIVVKDWAVFHTQLALLNYRAVAQNKLAAALMEKNAPQEFQASKLQAVFGFYALPALPSKIFLGPFGLAHQHEMNMFLVASDGTETRLPEGKVIEQGSRWLFTEGKEQGVCKDFGKLQVETPIEIADRRIAEKLTLKCTEELKKRASEEIVLPKSGVQDLDVSLIFSDPSPISIENNASLQTNLQATSIDEMKSLPKSILQLSKSLSRYSTTSSITACGPSTETTAIPKLGGEEVFSNLETLRIKLIPSIPSIGYLQGHALPNGKFKLVRGKNAYDLQGLNQWINNAFSARIKFVPSDLKLTWTPVSWTFGSDHSGQRCLPFKVDILDGSHILMEDGVFSKDPHEMPTAHELYQINSRVLTTQVTDPTDTEQRLKAIKKELQTLNVQLVNKYRKLLEELTDVMEKKKFHARLVEILLNPSGVAPLLKQNVQQTAEVEQHSSNVIDLDSDIEEMQPKRPADCPVTAASHLTSSTRRSSNHKKKLMKQRQASGTFDDEVVILDSTTEPKLVEFIDLEEEDERSDTEMEPHNDSPLLLGDQNIQHLSTTILPNSAVGVGRQRLCGKVGLDTVKPTAIETSLLRPQLIKSHQMGTEQKSVLVSLNKTESSTETHQLVNMAITKTTEPSQKKLYNLLFQTPAGTLSCPLVLQPSTVKSSLEASAENRTPKLQLNAPSAPVTLSVTRPTLKRHIPMDQPMQSTGAKWSSTAKICRVDGQSTATIRPDFRHPSTANRPVIGQLLRPTVGQPIRIIVKPSAELRQPSVTIEQPSATIRQHSTVIRQPSAVIRQSSAAIWQTSAVIRQPSAVIRQPSAVIRQPSAVIRQPSAVIRQPSPAIRQPSAVIRQPSAAIRQPSVPIRKPMMTIRKPPIAIRQVGQSAQSVVRQSYTAVQPVVGQSPVPIQTISGQSSTVTVPIRQVGQSAQSVVRQSCTAVQPVVGQSPVPIQTLSGQPSTVTVPQQKFHFKTVPRKVQIQSNTRHAQVVEKKQSTGPNQHEPS